MHLTRMVLGVAGIPFLTGCMMMGGLGHAGGLRRLDSSPAGTYQAQYGFCVPGLYLVTVDGRMGTGAHVRIVSVTTVAEIRRDAHGAGSDWLVPVVVLGGLGTAAMMAFMMGGSAF